MARVSYDEGYTSRSTPAPKPATQPQRVTYLKPAGPQRPDPRNNPANWRSQPQQAPAPAPAQPAKTNWWDAYRSLLTGLGSSILGAASNYARQNPYQTPAAAPAWMGQAGSVLNTFNQAPQFLRAAGQTADYARRMQQDPRLTRLTGVPTARTQTRVTTRLTGAAIRKPFSRTCATTRITGAATTAAILPRAPWTRF